jgi:hypothetical protein
MPGYRAAFITASCVAPGVGLVMLGVRSLSEPMKLFGPMCVPIHLAIWAALAALSFSAARGYARWARGGAPQGVWSGPLIILVGFLQGYAAAMSDYGLHALVAVVALGPALFRSASPEPLVAVGESRDDAAQLHARADEPRSSQPRDQGPSDAARGSA